MIAIVLRMHVVVLHYYNIINNYKNVNIQLSCLICVILCSSGGAQDYRDSPGHEPLRWIRSASSADPLCSSVRSH